MNDNDYDNDDDDDVDDVWSSWACQEGKRKLHRPDPRQHQKNRAEEDRPPATPHILRRTIHQVIQLTYECPKLMD